jgi:soluble lytic murein transglycosylase-like protein
MRARAFLLAVLVLALFPVAASANYAHVVKRGETLTSVAAIDGLSSAAVARANGISPRAELIAGQTLWIPPQRAAVPTTTSSTSTAQASTSTAQAPTTTTQTTAQSSATTVQTASTSAAAGAPVPTPERVSSSEIAAVADANGVPTGLAEGIAWQESGWNNDEVSSVGAVGVMQIVPTTWAWIDRYLTPADPLGTVSATENVRAGVLLLHQLLEVTGGNETLAVAGYFQGLSSVKRFGMFRSTRRYVADVMALAQRFGA